MDWQPIDTYPKDFELFDVWSEQLGRVPDCVIGTETYSDLSYKKKQGIVYQSDYDYSGPVYSLITDATHWMRVDPPNKKGSAD